MAEAEATGPEAPVAPSGQAEASMPEAEAEEAPEEREEAIPRPVEREQAPTVGPRAELTHLPVARADILRAQETEISRLTAA